MVIPFPDVEARRRMSRTQRLARGGGSVNTPSSPNSTPSVIRGACDAWRSKRERVELAGLDTAICGGCDGRPSRPDCDPSPGALGGGAARRAREIAELARPYIFACRKLAERWTQDPRSRLSLLRAIRPTANHLAGYSPSTYVLGLRDDV